MSDEIRELMSKGYANPTTLAPEHDTPHRIQHDVPRWSENYCSQAYDPATGLGVWLHIGRTNYRPDLWREIAVVYLPDGRFVTVKGYGRAETNDGPGAATMRFRALEPWNRWRKTLDGAGVVLEAATPWQGLVRDGEHVPVAFDLEFEGVHPAWDVGSEMRKQSWGHVHYEQVCAVTGTVAWADQTVPFAGTGIRDHTHGPRDYTAINHHCWLHTVFPDGSGFITVDVDVEGHRLSVASTFDDTATFDAEVVATPMLTAQSQATDPWQLAIRDHTGHLWEIEGEQLHVMPYAFIGECEIALGYEPSSANQQLYEGQTRLTCGGKTGFGLTERSLRVTPAARLATTGGRPR